MSFAELRKKITEAGGAANPRILPAVFKRLESFRHYDQDIERSGDAEGLREFWEDVKRLEEENLERLEVLLEESSIERRVH